MRNIYLFCGLFDALEDRPNRYGCCSSCMGDVEAGYWIGEHEVPHSGIMMEVCCNHTDEVEEMTRDDWAALLKKRYRNK